ncbi:transcriptional activator NhaR [Vibrio sp. SS-MA-C1-2]|uniref:transcriptional activator NhaR n=1 Tax=Vibrio sp. SS-MA-C1-2 TaxID=2908646 RepID=UPI001F1F0AE8|nr:transcriptional activator NhaR [Vibrio sp. SS-MA-C1-2]UJF19683.1 transcriptional activator NhaR [Vibrio sp. SS-MA-C1-2]
MSHLNYNHLYYFWMVCKQGSVTKAAEALFLAPQTVTGQIRALEERFNGKLTKRAGRNIEPTELGQMVFKYADKMFGLSYEMLDIVNYSQRDNILLEVGVADGLSKRLVSKVLQEAMTEEDNLHICCFESTHELLLEQLSQHKLDMIISDCPVDSTQNAGLFSKKLGECGMSIFSSVGEELAYPQCLELYSVLLPSRRAAMGRKIHQYFDQQGLRLNVMGEFDDAALMKAFAMDYPALFIAPDIYAEELIVKSNIQLVTKLPSISEEYYLIFAERMIKHPAVQRIYDANFSTIFGHY